MISDFAAHPRPSPALARGDAEGSATAESGRPGRSVRPGQAASTRVLVLVLDAGRGAPLSEVLASVPASLRDDPSVHFLAIGFPLPEEGGAAVERPDGATLTVVAPARHLSVGASQKLGLRYAVDGGFDVILVVRADAPPGPTTLPTLLAAWHDGRPGIVLGARPAKRGLRGLRDRLVGRAHARLSGRALEDPTTPFRAYDARLLASVPFEIDANDVRFDLELLLQAVHVDAEIIEVPVDAPPSAAPPLAAPRGEVLGAAVQFKLHQMGMLCSLKYRGLGDDRYPDKTGMVYSSHRVALDVVRELAPRSVLDLGSGRGYVARECERLGADVTGVDIAPPPGGSPRTFITHDLDEPKLPVDPFAFDVVLLLDVIEHLSNPEDFLVEMRNAASTLRATPSRLVLSTPNVAFASLRASLLLGRFNYAERGILDTTHKRLFTRDSLLSMLADCGYDVERVLPIGVPFEAVVGGPIGRSLARRCDALARRWPTLFAFQFMVLATPSPGIRQLLADTPRRDVSLRSLDAARPRS